MSEPAPVVYANGLIADDRADLPDPKQIVFCQNWLRVHARKRKTINRRSSCSAYSLKHRVEDWTETLGHAWRQIDPRGRPFVSTRHYVATGSFIIGAMAEGYRIEQIRNGPNCYFNIDIETEARS